MRDEICALRKMRLSPRARKTPRVVRIWCYARMKLPMGLSITGCYWTRGLRHLAHVHVTRSRASLQIRGHPQRHGESASTRTLEKARCVYNYGDTRREMRRDRQHTSTIYTWSVRALFSSSILVILNFRSLRVTRTLCFVLDHAVVYLLSPLLLSTISVPLVVPHTYSLYPEICLPINRDQPFGATGCSRVPIGAHNNTGHCR